ncbi:MAG: DUF1294 domain-containing protein [Clostridia bacterium]|nr:DUF1294 domain-containing protein [Clostridia bacterium]
MTLKLLWGIWAAINVIVFALYGVDKRRAIRGAWRIPERTLLIGTWLLGGVGAWLAMRIFRHKTKHIAFQVSAPIGAILSLLLMLLASARLLNLI